MSERLVLPESAPLRRRLEEIAGTERLVVFAGIPGAGKSLLVQQLALMARAAGRRVHLLQWDVARSAFETPALLSKYPEVNGISHPAIIGAVGLWVRDAIVAWHQAHPGSAHLLIGEAPLVGGRLIELGQPGAEPAESLLAGPGSRFVVPVPSLAVRRAIESRRAATSAAPGHEREAADARPKVVQESWNLVFREGVEMGLLPGPLPAGGVPYDPGAYRLVYGHWLRHRRLEMLPVDDVVPVTGSVYEVGSMESELRATPAEVDGLMEEITRRFPAPV